MSSRYRNFQKTCDNIAYMAKLGSNSRCDAGRTAKHYRLVAGCTNSSTTPFVGAPPLGVRWNAWESEWILSGRWPITNCDMIIQSIWKDIKNPRKTQNMWGKARSTGGNLPSERKSKYISIWVQIWKKFACGCNRKSISPSITLSASNQIQNMRQKVKDHLRWKVDVGRRMIPG